MINKAIIWLIAALVGILTPLLYAYFMIFPLLTPMYQLLVLVMHLLAAGAFVLLLKKWKKVTSDAMFTIGFLVLLLVPVGFALFMIVPLVAFSTGLFYVLMHLIFAGAVTMLVAFWGAIKKIF